MLSRGMQLPHLTFLTVAGDRIVYRDFWQHHSVAIVCVADGTAAQPFIDAAAEFDRQDAICIVTRESHGALPCPGIVVADRWGEIAHVGEAVPPVEDVLAWIEHLAHRCPECEGEVR